MWFRLVYLCLLACLPLSVYGNKAHKHVSFEVFSQSDGLDNTTVYAIHQDVSDQIWFLTDMGLSRYDGLRFHNFRIGQTKSPPISFFAMDELLVVAMQHGELQVFDPRYDQFSEIGYDTLQDFRPLDGTRYVHGEGNMLYAANDDGLFRLELAYDHPERPNRRVIMRASAMKDAAMRLQLIASDNCGHLFSHIVGTTSILRYEITTGRQEQIDYGASFGRQKNLPVSSLFAFDDNLWIGLHQTGIAVYDYATQRMERLSVGADRFPGLSTSHFFEVIKSGTDVYYIASQQGLFRFTFRGRPVDNDCLVETAPPFDRSLDELVEPQTFSVFFDPKRNVLWSGTFGGGVVKYNMNAAFYDQLVFGKAHIYNVTQDIRGYVWVTTRESGILRSERPELDRNTRFASVSGAATSDNHFVLFNDVNANELWFGDREGNLIQIDQQTEMITHQRIEMESGEACRSRINKIYIDSRKRMWIAADSGLMFRSPGEHFFRHVDLEYSSGRVTAVVEGSDGAIWAGTERGVVSLMESNGVFHAVSGYEAQVGQVPSVVYTLFRNGKGQMLVAYADKMLRINPSPTEHKQIDRLFTLNDGLESGHITSLADDRLGNTWIGTNTGIVVNKSGGEHFFTYAYSGATRDVCRLDDGRLVWANSMGLLYFDPYAIREFTNSDYLLLSDMSIDGAELKVGELVDGRIILPQTPGLLRSLTLPKRSSSVTLYFSDVHYSVLPKRLIYKLEPEMERWDTVAVASGISFRDLPAGDYSLRVRMLYYDDSVGDVFTWDVAVRQPWYATGWAQIGYILLAVSLLWIGGLHLRRYIERGRQRYVRMVMGRSVAKLPDPDGRVAERLLIVGAPALYDLLAPLLVGECGVSHAASGSDGLQAILTLRPGGIVCGTELSDGDGFEWAERLKEDREIGTVSLAMLGQKYSEEDRMRAQHVGAKAYLTVTESPQVLRGTLMELLRARRTGENGTEENKPEEESREFMAWDELFIRRVIRTVEEYVDEPGFCVRRLAEVMNMSQSTLYRKVIQCTQSTVLELIRDVRLNRSTQLLLEQKYTIQSIAEMVGYSDVATFRRHFTNLFGTTPSQYIRTVSEQRQREQEMEK